MIANINIEKIDFAAAKILVVGDVMLDQYWYGNTDRISPEAPVPIVRVNNADLRLGGAANVAWNLRVLGAQVKLLGLVGHDEWATQLRALLTQQDIQHELISAAQFPTTRKLRILSRQQQMLRLDHEQEQPHIQDQDLATLLQSFATMLPGYDAVILSDYAKGALKDPRRFIALAQAHNIPVFVDPKSIDFTIYQGATVLKPNLKEFEAVVGKCPTLEVLEAKAQTLLKTCDIQTLVITRGADGIAVITADQPMAHVPAYSGEVFDVTGAGDTVLAMLVAARACAVDMQTAVSLSSLAAAIVVGKVGTATASIAEIKNLLHKKIDLPTGIMAEDQLREIIKISQSRGEKVVFVNGCYDLLHYGHIRYFDRARAFGDRLVVGINSDASVRALNKGPGRPVYNLAQRMEVIASLKAVDWVVSFEESTPGRLVESLTPDILVKSGENFKSVAEIPLTEGTAHVLQNGGAVHILERTPDCSSTKAIEYL